MLCASTLSPTVRIYSLGLSIGNYKFYQQGYDDFGSYQSDRLQQSIYGTAQRIPNMSELISLNDIIRTEQILGDRLESVEAEQWKLR
jgi:hypothetical protein